MLWNVIKEKKIKVIVSIKINRNRINTINRITGKENLL